MMEATKIAMALAQIEDVACVTRGWPKQDARLPCVAVMLDERCPADHRDDGVYLIKHSYTVRVFAATMNACDTLGDAVTDVMETLDYYLTQTSEADDETAQLMLQFEKLL